LAGGDPAVGVAAIEGLDLARRDAGGFQRPHAGLDAQLLKRPFRELSVPDDPRADDGDVVHDAVLLQRFKTIADHGAAQIGPDDARNEPELHPGRERLRGRRLHVSVEPNPLGQPDDAEDVRELETREGLAHDGMGDEFPRRLRRTRASGRRRQFGQTER